MPERVDAAAGRAQRGGGDHRGFFIRWGRRRSPCRRTRRCACALRPSPVGVDAAAAGRVEVRAGVHRRVSCSNRFHPLGSMQPPPAARTLVLVFIIRSLSGHAVRVDAVALARADACRGVHAVSVSAQGADGGAFARVQLRGRSHRRLLQPLGSMVPPHPARTVVVVFIGLSWSSVVVDAGAGARANRGLDAHLHLPWRVDLSRWGPSRGPGRRVPQSRCASPLYPLGSMPKPRPARIVVVACMASPPVGVDAGAGARADRGLDAHLDLRESGGTQPLGSIMDPWPARMVVLACMAAPRVSRCRPSAGLRRRGCGSGCSSSVSVEVSRWGRSSTPRRRGWWCVCSSASPVQPLGSIVPPRPARTAVIVCITLSPACGVSRKDRCTTPGRRGSALWCSSSRSFSRWGR